MISSTACGIRVFGPCVRGFRRVVTASKSYPSICGQVVRSQSSKAHVNELCTAQSPFLWSTTRQRHDLGAYHSPSDFDKLMLVKAKMYSDKEDVPKQVSFSQMKKAKDLYRIRVSIWMMVATAVGCVIMVISGKRLHKSGDSLEKRGREQQARWREQGLKEQAEREAAATAQASSKSS